MEILAESARRRAAQRLANYPLFAQAGATAIEKVIAGAEFSLVNRGERILEEGQAPTHVTFVLEGAVRIFHTAADGRQFTPKILAAPNHFGDVELISGHTLNFQSVELIDDGCIARVHWPVLREVLQSDHAVCLGWLGGLASQFVYTIDADRHNVFSGLPGRVANVLLSYAEVYGAPIRDGIELGRPLSLDRLAREVGSVKRSIIRVLQTFEAQGWVEPGKTMVLRRTSELIAATLPGRLGLTHAAPTPDIIEPKPSGER
jgi:CRP/FNR family transcriptional regulator, cyclic AMP receptor protein